jgi:hypothetical protein
VVGSVTVDGPSSRLSGIVEKSVATLAMHLDLNTEEKTMYDINQIIKMAKDLEIKLTNAELDTELCQCWIDRVLQANMQFERGDMAACLDTIEEANRYANLKDA